MTNILSDIDLFLDGGNPVAIAEGVAERLKKRRLERNMSQQSLSGRSGVSLGSLKRFETRHEISLKHLLMLAVTLDSTEDFHALFSKRLYGSIDEVLQEKELKKRHRGKRDV
jgi:transcriptional regulator with XRE-family HTH domain